MKTYLTAILHENFYILCRGHTDMYKTWLNSHAEIFWLVCSCQFAFLVSVIVFFCTVFFFFAKVKLTQTETTLTGMSSSHISEKCMSIVVKIKKNMCPLSFD